MKLAFIFAFLSISLQAISINEWKKLSNDEKASHIQDEVPFDEISQKDIINQVEDIQDFVAGLVETDMDLEIHDDVHSRIGKMRLSYSFLRSDEGVLLGAMEYYFQQGCSKYNSDEEFEESYEYYETEAEANRSNCFDNDVSWSGYSIRDEYGVEIDNSGYLEWSGH